jgi:fructose-1,6-bisphosphatase
LEVISLAPPLAMGEDSLLERITAATEERLEGQLIARHPEWQMEHRRLLHRIKRAAGTVELDGVTYPLFHQPIKLAFNGSRRDPQDPS